MGYAERLYNSAYSAVVAVLGPLADSIDKAVERMGLEGAPLALAQPGRLETSAAAYTTNGNEHYLGEIPHRADIAWGGFYPNIDAKVRGHHNAYHGHNTKIAKAIYGSRAKQSKSRSPVDMPKLKRVRGGTKHSSRKVNFTRHSSLFKPQNYPTALLTSVTSTDSTPSNWEIFCSSFSVVPMLSSITKRIINAFNPNAIGWISVLNSSELQNATISFFAFVSSSERSTSGL